MFERKKILELEKELEQCKNDLECASKSMLQSNTACYKYKRLFSKLFTKLQVTNVKKYEVNNNLTDGLAIFNIEYNDGTCYTYEVKLVATGYKENLEDDQTR